LLAVGSRFVGTTEGCGALLTRLIANGSSDEEADRIVAGHRAERRFVPGFGHPQHKPDDPRSIRLIELAHAEGIAGSHVAAVEVLARAVDRAAGKHITLNATGAIAAVLGDCGIPAEILRGFAIIARAAGLVGHIHEEQRHPAMWAIWEAGDKAVPYVERGDQTEEQ
jgi:citrate synthase